MGDGDGDGDGDGEDEDGAVYKSTAPLLGPSQN